jgi:hypothetical protein
MADCPRVAAEKRAGEQGRTKMTAIPKLYGVSGKLLGSLCVENKASKAANGFQRTIMAKNSGFRA